MVKKTSYRENCSHNSRYNILQLCHNNPSSNPEERFHRTIIAMLRTRGDGIQDNWNLWINALVFTYNTTEISSTGWSNAPLRHVWTRSNATCGLGVSYTLCGEENNVSVDRRHAGRKTTCLQEHERCAWRKSKVERPDVQTFNPIQAGCLVWYFDPRIIPGTRHKLRSF